MNKEVGILLKVAASGLQNIELLAQGLKQAGVDTQVLDSRAAALQGELKSLESVSSGAAKTTKDVATAERAAASEAAYLAGQINLLEAEFRQEAAALLAAGEQHARLGAAATASGKAQAASHTEIRGGLQLIGSELNKLQNLVAVAIGGGLLGGIAKDLATTADQYNNLGAKIKLTTGEGKAFDTTFAGIFEIAQRTNTSLEATGTLFTKIAEAGKAIKLTQQDALALTETVNQATQLSGASAEASNAAITQLIQGLQSGVLRGDEFNSVMEQSPRLARALADGLGVTTGELRKMAEAGQLSSETIIRALQGQSRVLQEEFSKLPATVGRALQNLSTEWTRYIGEADQANGISAKAATAIGLLANNLSALATAARFAGEGWIAYKALNIAATLLQEQRAISAAVLAAEQEALASTAAAAAKGAKATATRAAILAAEAETAAVVVNTAATRANAAATETAAVAKASATVAGSGLLSTVGRIGSALGLGAVAAVLFGDTVVSAFKGAGTWIGEAAAKLVGYKDRSAEVLAIQKAGDDAARAQAQAMAELAQKTKLAADRALGLSDESRKLTADFDEARKKGETVAEALDKVANALRLDDISGIKSAVTALDVLQQQGKITGDQIEKSLGGALKGLDLSIFEVQARAVFDGTEQGARRLQLVLDAIATESLRRVGTSVKELKTGFSDTFVGALNDVDAVNATIKKLGINTNDTKRALEAGLDQSLAAANTDKALQAVVDRIQELAKEGRISGEYLGAALDKRLQAAKTKETVELLREEINKAAAAGTLFGAELTTALSNARKKAEELSPAFRAAAADAKLLGVELAGAAKINPEEGIRAFERLKASGKATAQEVTTAFINLANQQIQAANGVVPEWVKVESSLRGAIVTIDDTGKAVVKTLADAAKGTDQVIDGLIGIGDAAESAASKVNALKTSSSGSASSRSSSGSSASSSGSSSSSSRVPSSSGVGSSLPGAGLSTRTIDGRQVQFPDDSGLWIATNNSLGGYSQYAVDTKGNGIPGIYVMIPEANKKAYADYLTKKAANRGAAPAGYAAPSVASTSTAPTAAAAAAAAPTPAPAPAPAPSGPYPATATVIEIRFPRADGLGTVSAFANTQAEADAIAALLQEQFARAGGA